MSQSSRNGSPAGSRAHATNGPHPASHLQECASVNLLRRILFWQSALWATFGLALVFVPGWLVESLFDQPALGEDAWLRAAGVLAIAMAGQMVLVAHRVEDLWWWSWTFVFLEVATAVVFVLNALAGVPDGSSGWPWWLLGAMNAMLAALELAALAKAGTERSAI